MKYMYTNETMDGFYICVNGDSENFGEYTGLCCEDECGEGVPNEDPYGL